VLYNRGTQWGSSRASTKSTCTGLGFFDRVYEVVRLIPPGRVATYGQVAAIVSHRGAARTVGWALRGLPRGSSVPWHRVVNAKGQISIRGSQQAAVRQRALLEAEGVAFGEAGEVDLHKFRWAGLDWPEIEEFRRRWMHKPPKPDDFGG
jgi:methylated-DNA-protein-cysteine methyltransferase-like protein